MPITSINQLKTLKSGDVVSFEARVWTDAQINLSGLKNVTLKATGATFDGNSSITLAKCDGITLDGFVFKDGDLGRFGGDVAVIKAEKSPGTKIINSSITNVNPPKPSRTNEYKYIFLLSSPNSTVENCQFAEKRNGGAGAIAVNCTPGEPDNITIRRCLFKNMTPLSAATDANGYESIRIADSQRSQDDSNSLVEECVFINCGSDGEPEVVSLKRHNIIVRRCALYDCKGGLTSRHGGENKFIENYITSNAPGAIGIRLIGPNCEAIGNYVDVVDGEDFHGAIILVKGQKSSPLNGYFAADNAIVKNNTLPRGGVRITDGGKDLKIEPKNVQIIPGPSPYEEGKIKPLTENDLLGGGDGGGDGGGHTYVIGADPAEGNPDSDDSAACVIDQADWSQVATLAGKLGVASFAESLRTLAKFYNHAGVLVERNNHGHAILLALLAAGDVTVVLGLDGRPGWLSGERGKTLMYDLVADTVRGGGTLIYDESTREQLASVEASTLRAPPGLNDDRADAYALALAACRYGQASSIA